MASNQSHKGLTL